MKKKILSTIALLCVVVVTVANPVDRSQALKKAKEFLEQKGKSITSANGRQMRVSGIGSSEKEYFHIFNADNMGGYVIVSADDRTAPILGYVEQGEFSDEEIPSNMRSWLQHYADEMKWLEEHPATASETSQRRVQKPHHAIAPILTCLWDQGDPYNRMCPEYYNGDGSVGGRSATGCVATAIAQVLYHHKYPAKTKSRIPAMVSRWKLDNGSEKTVTLKAISSGTEIDWDNMQDTYHGNETEAEKDAVAKLMLIVGQALKMGYGPSSGSSYAESRKLFVDYLGYDDGVQILRSDDWGIQEWFEMLYEELDKGYPIGYGGTSTGGGHAFVLDGFDGNDLFHVNWGWGGASNGYFRMTVLNPGDNSGIGASSSADGYSMGQDAIMYLRAEDDGETYQPESKNHMTINDTSIDGTKISSNYINWTGTTGSFNGAIVMKNENGEFAPVSDVKTVDNLGTNYYVKWEFDLKNCFSTSGNYLVTPASKLKTEDKWHPLYNFKHEYIIAHVDDNLNVELEKHVVPIELEVTHWGFPGTLKAGDQQDVNITLKNNGTEFKRELALYASKTNDMGGSVSRALIGVLAGDTDEFTFFFKPNDTGTWNLWLTLNSDRNTIIGQTTVEIGNTAKNKANLAVNSVSVQGNAYGDFLMGSMTVKNNGTTDFSGFVNMQIWHEDGAAWWSGSSQKLYYEIPAGKTASADFYFDNLRIGDKYRFNQRYTTQDGELTNGGVFNGDEWKLKAGALTWSKAGTVAGSGVTTNFRASSTAAGIWFCSSTPASVTPASNPNTVYLFDGNVEIPSELQGKNVVVGNEAEEINLIDGNAVYFPQTFTAKKATFTYTANTACDGHGNWVALTLPFAPQSMTIDGRDITWTHDGKEGHIWIKQFSEVDDGGQVVFDDAESLRDATPYLIGVPQEYAGKEIVFKAENITFKSTRTCSLVEYTPDFQFYGITYSPRLSNVYTMNDSGTAFVLTENNRNGLPSFRNYFTTGLDVPPVEIPIKLAKETLVNSITTATQETEDFNNIHDLQGRKLNPSNLQRGVYIVGSKKMIK